MYAHQLPIRRCHPHPGLHRSNGWQAGALGRRGVLGQYGGGGDTAVIVDVERRRTDHVATGAGGGALLAKPAAQIRLLDVYRAVEDTEMFTLHRTPPCENCAVGGNIQAAIAPSLASAQSAFEAELAKVTIADMAAEVARIGKFSIPLVW